jgi:hypothetical protein
VAQLLPNQLLLLLAKALTQKLQQQTLTLDLEAVKLLFQKAKQENK